MPRADFYLLSTADAHSRLQLACRLAEKAWRRRIPVVILAEDAPQAAALDRLLWQVREAAFVPHELWGKDTELKQSSAVIISWSLNPQPLLNIAAESLLVQLSLQAAEAPNRFERYAEIVIEDDAIKQSTRQRYRQYQQQGITVHTHSIAS